MEIELVAVIAACSVCFVLGVIIAVFIGCYCGQRRQKKKVDEESSRQKSSIKDWANKASPLVASESGFGGSQHKLGTYQPKILSSRSISQEHLILGDSKRNSSKVSKAETNQRSLDLRRYSSGSDIRMTEIDGRNVSVVEVKNRNPSMNGFYGYYNGGAIVPGYMVGNHIYPEHPSQQHVRQGQIVVARAATCAEESRSSYVISGQNSHVIKQHVSVDQSGQVVSTYNNSATRQSVDQSIQTSYSETALQASTVQQVQSQIEESSTTTPITTVIVSSPTEVVLPITSTTTTTTQIVNVEEETQVGSEAVVQTQQEDIARPPRWMEEQFEENSRSMEFDDDEEENEDRPTGLITPIEVSTFGAVRMVNTGIERSQSRDSMVTNTVREDEVVIEDWVDPEPRPVRMLQPLQPATYLEQTVIVDHPDDQPTTSRTVTTTTTISEEVTKTTQQLVNESAEGVPPASTSTPRALPDASLQMDEEEEGDESVTTFRVTSHGTVLTEDVQHRRQRGPDVETILPPSNTDFSL